MTKKPLGAAADSSDGIATGSALVAKPDAPAKPDSHSTSGGGIFDSAMREKVVREAAYFRAERRDFSLGGELGDWIAADRAESERSPNLARSALAMNRRRGDHDSERALVVSIMTCPSRTGRTSPGSWSI